MLDAHLTIAAKQVSPRSDAERVGLAESQALLAEVSMRLSGSYREKEPEEGSPLRCEDGLHYFTLKGEKRRLKTARI